MHKPLFLLLLLSTLFVQAQTPTVGDTYPEMEGARYYLSEGSSTLTIALSNDRVVTQKFDNETLAPGIRLTNLNPKKEVPFWAGKIGGNYYVLYYSVKNDFTILAREVNLHSGVLVNEASIVLIDPVDLEGYGQVTCIPAWFGNKFIIRYRLKNDKNRNWRNNHTYRIHYFDGSLTPVKQNTITVPLTEKDLSMDGEFLDSKWNLYVGVLKLDNEYTKTAYVQLTKYKTDLLLFTPDQPDAAIITPDPVSGQIAQHYVFELANGRVLCAGVNNNTEYTNATGILLYELKADGRFQYLKKLKAPFFDGGGFYPNDLRFSCKIGLTATASNFRIDQVLEDTAGSYVLIGQSRLLEAKMIGPVSSQSLSVNALFGPIVAFGVQADGSRKWTAEIPAPDIKSYYKKLYPTYYATRSKKGIAVLYFESPTVLSLAKTGAEEGTFSMQKVADVRYINEKKFMVATPDRFFACPPSALFVEVFLRDDMNKLIRAGIDD